MVDTRYHSGGYYKDRYIVFLSCFGGVIARHSQRGARRDGGCIVILESQSGKRAEPTAAEVAAFLSGAVTTHGFLLVLGYVGITFFFFQPHENA